jgi:hypothetical protein
MRTRRLHARLAYVKRADNRASVAYAAASARSVRRSFLSPEASWYTTFRGRAAHRMLGLARHAGSNDAHKATARTLMRTLGKSLRRAPTPCDNHIQRESFRASSAPTCSVLCHDALRPVDTKEWQQKTRRMAANSARVSGPMHQPCTVKLCSSALYRQVK